MDAIERAIRGALEKGNAEDRTFREKVYRSVFTALERSIAANPDVADDVAQRRRALLKAKITEIEQEFQPARPAEPSAPAVGRPEDAPRSAQPAQGPREAPFVEAASRMPAGDARDDGPEPTIESPEPAAGPRRFNREAPAIDDAAADLPAPGFAAGASPEGRLVDREEPRRRSWGLLLIAVTVLAALAIGGWWVFGSGLFGRPDGSVPNPPVETAEEDFEPEPAPPRGPGTVQSDRNWVTVFSPADPVSVRATSGTFAEIMQEEGQSFIRIRSGANGEAVLFDIGPGILERIAGRRAIFDIVARTEEGRETQISVECDFGGLGDCGRRRYLVGTHRADYLFEVELPSGRPGAGSIAIVSDVENAGKAIDVFEIRVSLAD